jgi:uncharacterized protein YegL
MSGHMTLVKESMSFIVRKSESIDRISVINFGSDAKVCCPLTSMDKTGKETVQTAINSLVANGGTNTESGFALALQQLADQNESRRSGLILLLSDGDDKSKTTVNERIKKRRAEFSPRIKCQYKLHTFGYGPGHDTQVMKLMAKENNGYFFYVENTINLPKYFDFCFTEMSTQIARNVRVRFQKVPCSIGFSIDKVNSSSGNQMIEYPSL